MKTFQSRGVRYFPALSCSQDPTVSQTELLAKQVAPPCCLALKVSDYLTGKMRHLHQIIYTFKEKVPTCPKGTHRHCKHELQCSLFISASTKKCVPHSFFLQTEKNLTTYPMNDKEATLLSMDSAF